MKPVQLAVTILISIIFAATSVVLPAAAQSGGIGGRPANPDPNNPRTQSIFIMSLERGESGTDTILVANNTDQKQTIELYAVDGVVSNSGAYSCRQESEARIGLGSWAKIAKDQVVLDAGQREEVKFTVTMPKNADVGEHNGCIVFQTPDTDEASSGSVRVKTRQAVRLVVTIPGDLHREIAITSFDVNKSQKSQPLYSLVLQNQGNVSADVDAVVTVSSLWGNEIYRNGGGYPVIADQKLELAFEHPAQDYPMFGGWYRAGATVEYDKDAGTFGTQNAANLITKRTDEKIIFLAPTLTGVLVIAFVLLAAGGAAGYYWTIRRKNNDVRNNGQVHVVTEGETVQTIAEKYDMDWKRLVGVNKVKPPYVLSVGQRLHVPNATPHKKK